MKFAVIVGGKHKAEIDIQTTGKSFAGSVSSMDFGIGHIGSGVIAPDGSLSGKVTLDGYEANFAAKIADGQITGTLKYGWFFNESFVGTCTDSPTVA